MIEPIIPRSQPLRFVSMINYETNPYTHDSKLMQDAGRSYDDVLVHCKKFDYSDLIYIQFTCSYLETEITLKLYNSNDTLIGSIAIVKNELSTGVFYYNASIDCTLLLGFYYCRLEFSGLGKPRYLFQTDYFKIGDFEKYPKLEYTEKSDSGLIYKGLKFGFRIEADITFHDINTETETFKVFNSQVVNASSKIYRVTKFSCDPIHIYNSMSLDLAFSHRKVYLNGREIVASEPAEKEPLKDILHTTYERDLIEAKFEVYEMEAAMGGEPPAPSNFGYSPDGINFYSPDGLTIYTPY